MKVNHVLFILTLCVAGQFHQWLASISEAGIHWSKQLMLFSYVFVVLRDVAPKHRGATYLGNKHLMCHCFGNCCLPCSGEAGEVRR